VEGPTNPRSGEAPAGGEAEGERAVSAAVDRRASAGDAPRDDGPRRGGDSHSGDAEVVRQLPGNSPAELRADFGAHLEANYQRLVAQLYAITLDPGEAHDVVQDAYSRAWRSWVAICRMPDPSAWIRRVAVRSTIRSWRRVLARFGIGRPRAVGVGADQRTRALLAALGRLSPAERRAVVLHHMAGASLEEIAAVEQSHVALIEARLARARHVVTEGMADVLPDVLGAAVGDRESGSYAKGYGLHGPGSGAYRSASDGYGADGYGADGYGADGRDDEGERR
jgi:DNA-directed RNA polymerase specialized sigma24 family protein